MVETRKHASYRPRRYGAAPTVRERCASSMRRQWDRQRMAPEKTDDRSMHVDHSNDNRRWQHRRDFHHIPNLTSLDQIGVLKMSEE
jgi:hypothetical protein